MCCAKFFFTLFLVFQLYEATVVENERLREKLQKTEDALSDTKSQVDKSSVFVSKNNFLCPYFKYYFICILKAMSNKF